MLDYSAQKSQGLAKAQTRMSRCILACRLTSWVSWGESEIRSSMLTCIMYGVDSEIVRRYQQTAYKAWAQNPRTFHLKDEVWALTRSQDRPRNRSGRYIVVKSLLEAYHRGLNRDQPLLKLDVIIYQPRITESEPWLINLLVSSHTKSPVHEPLVHVRYSQQGWPCTITKWAILTIRSYVPGTSSSPRRSTRSRRNDMHKMRKKKKKHALTISTKLLRSLGSGLRTLMIKVRAVKYSAHPSPNWLPSWD